ncbi:MAG TPA: hypothetical protein VLK58_09085, partial [Conexibacter sp.]|nr:hypothetical protein [Conexibacter sp.]
NIIFGATIDDRLTGQVWVTVVATGYGEARPPRPAREERGADIGVPREQRAAAAEERAAPSRTRFADPAAGEVRVARTSAPREQRQRDELDVPEFMPFR